MNTVTGPWKVSFNKDSDINQDVVDRHGEHVVYGCARINAPLIAAAPEMLEALKHARMLLDELAINNPDHPDKFNGNWASYQYEFDAVIAKAEGRS